MRKGSRTGFLLNILHFYIMKCIFRRKALILSAFLVFIQLATPLTSIAVYAASVTSNDVGSTAALDPVGNKASRLQTQGTSGVDQSSGALTYSYPLSIPEGRGGMSPKLALSYNSQNNDSGWFGYGWTMSIPYIDRTVKVGTDKMYTNPAFVSSLHGELTSSNGVNYEQKVDDGSFAKYTFSSTTWQMTDRDGTTYYFGNSYYSRTQNDAGTKIGRWYLTEVRDKFGNGILYSYIKDNGTVYPSTISYTEHALAHPLNLVTFNLENKNDRMISYKYGFRTTDTKRVSYIKVVTSGKDNSYFTFNYTTGSNGVRSLLHNVEEKHLSTNDDWTALPKTIFEYENSSTTFSGTITNTSSPYGSSVIIDTNNDGILDVYGAADGYFPIDINGDYKKDLIYSDIHYNFPSDYNFDINYSYNIGTNGGTDFFLRKIYRPYSPYANAFPQNTPAPPLRSNISPSGVMVNGAVITDVNGDGFDDIVYYDPYGGSGLAINTTNNTFEFPALNGLSFLISTDQTADINGDGLQDKITRSNTSTSTLFSVYLNNGTSYSSTTDYLYDAKITPTTYDVGVRFVDVNNDGLVDVVRSYSSSSTGGSCPVNQVKNEINLNVGSSFVLSSSTLSGYLVTYSTCAAGNTTKEYDTNGDLTTDYDGSVNNTLKQDVLKKVTGSLGSTLDVTYTWSSKTGLNPLLPVPMYIVATTTDKLSESDTNPHSVAYNFSDGQMYFDVAAPRDHKFAGFGKVTVTDGPNKTTTYYHQGNTDDYTTGEENDSYYSIGRPYRTDTFDLSTGSSTLVSKNLSLYTTYSYASSSFTYLDSQVSNIYNSNGSYLSSGNKSYFDVTKRLIKTSYAYGDIEPFISFASSTIIDKGTDLLTTSYEYSNTRPQRLVKQFSVDYSGKTVEDTTYYYDNLPRSLVDKGVITSIYNIIYNQDGTINSSSTSQTSYDATGNAIQTIDGLGRITRAIYNSTYFFPTSKIDALNGTTTFSYDPYTLNLLTSRGPDGITSVKETDGLGKVTRSYTLNTSGGMADETRTTYVYGGGISVYSRKLGSSGANARSVQIYDSYGRLIQSKNETSTDIFLTQDTTYDARSNILSTSLPYTTYGYGQTTDTPTNGSTIYTYDGLGRVLTKSAFGTTLSYQYSARSLLVQDNASTQHKKSYSYDANGNISQVNEYNGSNIYTTSYNYTPLNKLSRITDANGNIRNFSYLSNGALVYQEDPHSLTDTTYAGYSYTYDSLGNLLTKAGTLGTTTYAYDSLNRPTTRTLADATYGTSTISIVYTGCSNNYLSPCTINRSTSSTTLAYNGAGKLSSETLSIDGKSFARTYAYDTFSNPTTITYPDNGQAVYTYTLDGKQSMLSYVTPSGVTKNIVTSSSYNSLGALSTLTYGNGIQMCNSYTSTSTDGSISPKLSKSAYVFNSTGCSSSVANQIELYKDQFTYKDNLTPSNVFTTYKDILGTTHTRNDTFTYDNLARLTQISTSYDGGTPVTDALVYDPIGNIISENDILYRYSLDGTQNVHAVTSVGGMHITYDAQGNRIQVGDNAYAWNALNQMIIATSTTGTEFYTYDENGERIKRVIKATSVISQKVTPSASTTAQATFSSGNFLAIVATSSTYIATSTYNTLSSLSLLSTSTLTTLVGEFYSSPFTSKSCMSATSTSNRQSCIATTTKQLLANNINSRSTSTVATNGLITDILNIVTGTYLIPSTYSGLATSSIATSATSTFTIISATITAYNTFVATGVMVAMSEYANLPYVSTTTYASLALVGLTDTSKVRALLTLSGCTTLTTACATAKKVVFEKYYKESGYLLSDKALQEMWYIFAAKARLPGNSLEFTSTSTTLGSISVPVVSSINTSAATTTYYSGKYFTTEYTAQNTSEPRLPYFNTVPYYINQTAFTELLQAGITQTTIDNYQSLIADLLGTRLASSTEYIVALKTIAQHDKNVMLSATTSRELYLVALGAAAVPNNITDYFTNSIFDVASYLSVETVYGAYGSTLSNTITGCHGGTYSTGYGRCTIRVSPFNLPIASTSQITYYLSVTAPNPIEYILNAGESVDPRRGTDSYNYGVDVPIIYSSRYAPATVTGSGMLEYISGTISLDGFTQTIDVTSTIVKQKASSTEPAVVLLMNRSGWTTGVQYAYQSLNTTLKAYASTPRLTLASTTLVAGVTAATSSSFTAGIQNTISAYFGEISDSSNNYVTASTTATSLLIISPEAAAEFASTTLRDSYDISRVFLSTSTSPCITNASTTECDKQLRKAEFRLIIKNLTGFMPSEAGTEEFWMVHKGLLALTNISYASTTATTTVPGYWQTIPTSLASGGTISTSSSYTIHTFSTSSTFTASSSFNAEVLVVGGGGGGSSGGGGAGGYLASSSYAVLAQAYTVTVGAGGVGGVGGGNTPNTRTSGDNSVFGALTAVGGGYGGYNIGASTGATGGSGGGTGAYYVNTPASGTAGQGSSGGNSSGTAAPFATGGGGGAGGAGGTASSASVAGNGGVGILNSITGSTTVYYAGGGGGGVYSSGGTGGNGGSGGGGAGSSGGTGTAGIANTGGGGGGAGWTGSSYGGAGGSGVVIIKYLTSTATTSIYIATTTIQVAVISSSTTSSPFVFSRSSLPSSLSTTTSVFTSTTTLPGYWTTIGVYTSTGGTVATSGPFTTHTFTSSGTFAISTSTTLSLTILGGGGGGSGSNTVRGSGGGSGYTTSTTTIISSSTVSVVIGSGGAGSTITAPDGGSSSFGSFTANGGQGGQSSSAGAGGSGGGGYGLYVIGGAGGSAGANGTTATGNGGTGGGNATSSGAGGGGGSGGTVAVGGTGVYGTGGNGGNDGANGQNASGYGAGGGGSGGGSASGGNGASGVVIVRFLTSALGYATTTYIATSTISTNIPLTNYTLVPPGLLSDLQFNTTYSTSTFALATSTKVVSEDTYNELLRTPVRLSSDVDTVFDYALSFATSSCPGEAATSSCVVTAQKTKVKNTVSAFSGFALSDAALEELYKVKNNELAILPVSLSGATVSTSSQSVIVPLSLAETYITFATTTGTSTVATSATGTCAFGTSGTTTKGCYIDLPYINSSLSSLILSYAVTPTSIATSTLRSNLVMSVITSTTSTSTPTIITSASSTTFIGTKSATSTFSYDLSTLYQLFLSTTTSPTLTLAPDGNATSSTIYTLSTTTLTVTRSITVPRISYSTSALPATAFSRSSIPSYATSTATSTIDLTSLPPLTFSTTFVPPVGRIATGTVIYSGYIVDTTAPALPSLPQSALSSITYPYYSGSTTPATSTINILTVATTTTTTVYSPFSNYQDASSTITTYLTLNGTLVGAYTYQQGNEASTGKITYAHTNYLGTPVLETDDRGDIVQMDITDVFGNYVMRDQRKDNAYHNKGYTSHEFDDVTALNYSHARYLSAPMHSFMSVDPMLYSLPQSYLTDPQQMNSYAYARNNPIIYTDPDGKLAFLVPVAAALVRFIGVTTIASVLGSYANDVITNYINNSVNKTPATNNQLLTARQNPISGYYSDFKSNLGINASSKVSETIFTNVATKAIGSKTAFVKLGANITSSITSGATAYSIEKNNGASSRDAATKGLIVGVASLLTGASIAGVNGIPGRSALPTKTGATSFFSSFNPLYFTGKHAQEEIKKTYAGSLIEQTLNTNVDTITEEDK